MLLCWVVAGPDFYSGWTPALPVSEIHLLGHQGVCAVGGRWAFVLLADRGLVAADWLSLGIPLAEGQGLEVLPRLQTLPSVSGRSGTAILFSETEQRFHVTIHVESIALISEAIKPYKQPYPWYGCD